MRVALGDVLSRVRSLPRLLCRDHFGGDLFVARVGGPLSRRLPVLVPLPLVLGREFQIVQDRDRTDVRMVVAKPPVAPVLELHVLDLALLSIEGTRDP